MAGDRERAKLHYGKLIEIVGKGETTRPEFMAARKFMAAPT